MAKTGWTRSPLVGVLVGAFAGGLAVYLVEWIGHAVFGTADPSDLSSVTTEMFAAVLVAWIVGAAVAGGVATRWTRARPPGAGLAAGGLLLLGTIANLLAFPHPAWVAVAALVLMPLAALVAARTSAGAAADAAA